MLLFKLRSAARYMTRLPKPLFKSELLKPELVETAKSCTFSALVKMSSRRTNSLFVAATKIPAYLSSLRLDPSAPITHLLSTELPPLAPSVSVSDSDLCDCFTPELPDVSTALDPLTIPIPSFAPRLCDALRSQWDRGMRSIVFIHDRTLWHLELWWAELWVILLRQVNARDKWLASQKWFEKHIVAQPVHEAFAHVPLAIEAFFSTVGWDDEVLTPTGIIRTLQLNELFSNHYLPGKYIL